MKLRFLGIHDAVFHADEVTAAALLIIFDLVDRDKIVRTRDELLLAECEYVCDVGGVYDPDLKRFDHHQVSYRGKMSSAGMVLLYLKEERIISSSIYRFLDRALVSEIDAHDNGMVKLVAGYSTFSQVVGNFVPSHFHSSEEAMERGFFQALDFTKGHIDRLLEKHRYNLLCRGLIAEAMKERGDALLFSSAIPWSDGFFDLGGESHPALFVVMPSGSYWKLRAIPPNGRDRMAMRLPLPKSWAGLSAEDLQKETQIRGAIFCHKKRFISIWETREDAISALRLALKNKGKI